MIAMMQDLALGLVFSSELNNLSRQGCDNGMALSKFFWFLDQTVSAVVIVVSPTYFGSRVEWSPSTIAVNMAACT